MSGKGFVAFLPNGFESIIAHMDSHSAEGITDNVTSALMMRRGRTAHWSKANGYELLDLVYEQTIAMHLLDRALPWRSGRLVDDAQVSLAMPALQGGALS
jgi:hypothetical protein